MQPGGGELLNNDGIVDIPGTTGTGVSAVATVNVRVSEAITVCWHLLAGMSPMCDFSSIHLPKIIVLRSIVTLLAGHTMGELCLI